MSKYAVMCFDTEINLGVSSHPNKWVNTRNYYYNNGAEALNAYFKIPCPASQLIRAVDDYELKCKMGEMMINFRDENWLEKHLYPYM